MGIHASRVGVERRHPLHRHVHPPGSMKCR
jgi:hypothetical protein